MAQGLIKKNLCVWGDVKVHSCRDLIKKPPQISYRLLNGDPVAQDSEPRVS